MARDFRSNQRGGDREMYPATCGNCGKNCQVPFKPSGDRPVLCSECFGKNSDSRDNRYGGRDSGVRHYGKSENWRKPSGFRPDYHHPRDHQATGLGMQLELLNNKLDKIIALLTPPEVKKVEN